MIKQPEEIVLAKLEVILMPSGEIIFLGKHIGWFEKTKKYLTDPRSGMTGKPINEKNNT